MAVTEQRKEVAHDEAPAVVADHPFVPKGEWWSLCKTCNLGEAAHAETTLTDKERYHYYSDDNEDEDT